MSFVMQINQWEKMILDIQNHIIFRQIKNPKEFFASFCKNARDVEIFHDKFINKKKFSEIAKQHGLTSARIQSVYYNSLIKSKKVIYLYVIKDKMERSQTIDFIDVEQLPMTERCKNTCLNSGVNNLILFYGKSKKHISKLRNFGKQTFKELMFYVDLFKIKMVD